ncbi:MAG: glycosyltransferase family 2 protein [Pseudomonadota bacterium]
MRISVVTIAYNSAATIGHTVASFQEQTHRDAELLVIDGASRDDTVALVQGFGDPRVRVISEPDQGIYDAMNKGLAAYDGEAVGFLNSDDRYHDPGVLADIAVALEGHDAVCGNLDFVDNHGDRRVLRRWRGTPWRPGAFRRGWMPAHPTFYIRRAVAGRVGRFDTRYKISADYDFMLRALECPAPGEAVRVAFLERVMVDMMVGGASTAGWRAYLRGNLESLRARRQWLGAGPVDYALFAKPLGKLGQWLWGR